MLHRFFSWNTFRASMPFYLATLLLVLSFLVSLISNNVLYNALREAKSAEIDATLPLLQDQAEQSEKSVANAASYIMKRLREIYLMDNPPENDEQWVNWFKSHRRPGLPDIPREVRSIRDRTGFDSVRLLTLQRRVIADASGEMEPGEAAPYETKDMNAWTAAMADQTTVSLHTQGPEPFVRIFSPVHIREDRGVKGRIGAVLQMEATFEGFKTIKNLERLRLSLTGIVAVLTAVVAILFYRFMRVFVKISETAAHSDRLQAMGTLTAGIAHEIRNPLGIIRALAEGLQRDFEKADPQHEMLDDIVDEVRRLNGLVTTYLDFARPDPVQPGDQARPDEIIESLAPLLEKGEKESPAIQVEMAENMPPVQMSESALRQVLLNLLMNAQEASPPDQPINVRCSLRRGRGQVKIVVEDNGCGIAPRDLRHVFDPFYTTRVHGTGLGLSICRQLVTECRGKIRIDSVEGEGTSIRILLPASGKDAVEPKTEKNKEAK